MTSSARARIDGGTVRPSALAVFRLTTNSNLVGCSTGRSAGFSPFSPLRTDSRQLVSKIYWWQSAKNGIMRQLEWPKPTGFVCFAPALREDPGGCGSADHPKIARTAEVELRPAPLFGSGSAGLGSTKKQPIGDGPNLGSKPWPCDAARYPSLY